MATSAAICARRGASLERRLPEGTARTRSAGRGAASGFDAASTLSFQASQIWS
jgi:hypothetical protein